MTSQAAAHGLTPSQTVGPFLALALRWADGPFVVPEGTPGAFWIRGQVIDGAGEVVPDALVETWQADVDGSYDSAVTTGFRGFGRSETVGGEFAIWTVLPGRGDGAPHLDVSVFARGLLDRVVTRIYFPDDLDNDPVLDSIEPARAGTLIAMKAEDGYRFDIRLQGVDESVFFAV